MDNKCRPYLAMFPKAGLPVLVKNAKDFTTDIEPQLHTMANAFANHSCDSVLYKMCHKSCAENRRCSKKCMEEKQKRDNEMIVLERDEFKLHPVMEKLQRGEDPDTIVMIEFREFACSGVVLCTFSIFFNKFRGHPVIDLRRGPMSADTFEQVYKWMVQPNYIIKPENIVRLVRAANFLEIKFLLSDLYGILESNTYTDFWAFSIMTKSRHYTELFLVNQAMAMRISKAALIVICSQEFLTLNEMQICAFLNSSSLAINSETELLYGVLHWLNVGWPARRTSVLNVLKNLRFAYLSPKILCEMNVSPMEPFARILREFANQPESKQLVEDGIFHSTLVITLNGDASKLNDLPNAKRELMMPRHWARDIRCPYHRPVTKLCPNMRSISYEEFAAYSETLLDTDADYKRYFVYPQDDDGSEISSTNLSDYTENLNDSDDSKLSVWRTDSLLHWVHFECGPSFQMEDTLVTSINTGSGVPSNSSLHSQAEVATEHWQKIINKFKPSEIWDDWDEAFTEDDE